MQRRELLIKDVDLSVSHQDRCQCQRGLGKYADPFELGAANLLIHDDSSSSVCGNATIAEAGEGDTLPRGSGGRFNNAVPVVGVAPVNGWELLQIFPETNEDRTREYVARGPQCDAHVPVSRFCSAFAPTQARFDFLVSIGFAPKPSVHATGPWDDHDIDAAIAAARRAVAA